MIHIPAVETVPLKVTKSFITAVETAPLEVTKLLIKAVKTAPLKITKSAFADFKYNPSIEVTVRSPVDVIGL